MNGQPPILELRNLEVCYGKLRALNGINLCVQEGEIIALLGANGAGKTTALRAISGLLTPASGDILYRGRSIARRRPDLIVRDGIAHSPEERHIWPELSVRENLALGAYSCSDRTEAARRFDAVLERFPRLGERLAQLAGLLSGGEQQMLAIGRALMSDPRLLLLDEASLGLSPLMSQEVLGALRELCGAGDYDRARGAERSQRPVGRGTGIHTCSKPGASSGRTPRPISSVTLSCDVLTLARECCVAGAGDS